MFANLQLKMKFTALLETSPGNILNIHRSLRDAKGKTLNQFVLTKTFLLTLKKQLEVIARVVQEKECFVSQFSNLMLKLEQWCASVTLPNLKYRCKIFHTYTTAAPQKLLKWLI